MSVEAIAEGRSIHVRSSEVMYWRKLRGFDYLAKVITGVTFKDGIETTKPDQIAA
ncbi:hypothetical protein [Sulfitobacter sp.]|uniref:hypothetical protein n=1 Tax=Sulfitobacter sp. TaxID=1903071 RepID=UPI0030027155